MLSPEYRFAALIRTIEQMALKEGHAKIAKRLEHCWNKIIDSAPEPTAKAENIIAAVDFILSSIFAEQEDQEIVNQVIARKTKVVKMPQGPRRVK